MDKFLQLLKKDCLSSLICIIIFFLSPISVFGQLALADSGIIYGSTGYSDDGRLIIINKSTGEDSVIYYTGIGNRLPGLAINSVVKYSFLLNSRNYIE